VIFSRSLRLPRRAAGATLAATNATGTEVSWFGEI
jgi:hypothetical protein